MRNWKSAVLFVAAMFGGISSAFADDDSVRLRVDPLWATANYSVADNTYFVGYRVTIKNVGRRLSDNLVFRGRTLVRDRAEKAEFDSNDTTLVDPHCRTTNPNRTAIACRIGRLAPGATFGPFVVTFKTPMKKWNGKFDFDGQDFVNFRGTLSEADDKDDNVDRDFRNRVTLLSASDTQVSTVCPAGAECRVFTGNNGGAPTADDPFVTEVRLPAYIDKATPVAIHESVFDAEGVCFNESYSGFLRTIFRTDITIPNTTFPDFPYLKIFLRIDRTQACGGEGFAEGAASGIRIFYYPDEGGERVLVGNCDGPPSAAVPCIFNTRIIGGEDDFTGDYEAELRGKRNGGYRVE